MAPSAGHPDFGGYDQTDRIDPEGKTRPVVGAVLRAPEQGDVEVHIGRGVFKVGSGPGNDLVLENRTVSRSHAAFSVVPEGVVVEDLGSRNGTFFLGNRIGKMVLGLGTSVRLGSVTVTIEPDTEALLDGLDYEGDGYRGVLGCSPRIRKLFGLLQRLEGSLATVLLEGESGVGKEEVARAIHEGSPVCKGPFVTINCGAIARELVASELFGHRRGAFTGAVDARRGAFESANTGTLFLDEIGELPLDLQPALLRALEIGEVRAVGGDQTTRVSVRVLAATNRDLEEEVAAGRFRTNLFYRLAVVRVHVPPLRGRPEDVELLARHFARQLGVASLPQDIIDELKIRSWPGNARELRNAIQSFTAIGELPPPPRSEPAPRPPMLESMFDPTEPYQIQRDRLLDQFTMAYVRALLRYTNGNQSAAARVAKMDRTYLGRLMSRFNLKVRKIGGSDDA